jgi:hypothetical protein
MLMLTAVGIIALLAGCATTAQAPSGAQTFAGQVWTWDERDSTVTLMQDGGQRVRVKVTPEQLRTLRLHERTRVTGTPAPPADLVIASPSGPMTAVPKGQPAIVELKGTVTSADPDGRVAVNSDRGAVRVWAASGADQRFQKGAPVTVWMSVQPVDLVPGTPATPTPAPVSDPSASPSSEPGDHAVVTGRIIGINPGGVLVVESPMGPIQVLATDSARYKVGDSVQVRTTLRSS